MNRNKTSEDQRCSITGSAVPVLVMTDDLAEAEPGPDPGSHSLHMDIISRRNQQFMPQRPSLPCTFTPDTLLGVAQ